ncbi:branched-chain amino acid ABC transporter permease [Ralstonia syzygii]|uniref:Branched-chain amino acid ABC transporter,permease protein (LivH like) n=1 Tax=Ralstonia syzygii R24 TaxID=907261 RepID=G3A7I1_9RALS|nr:branched-chain amino acid ABC transporter permease [Ralstonia syzygii]CCA86454.1 Branched-chain amino acid ABC transporter,permease protein (livH like) [Ralstonia syzygii R24]
MEFFLQLVLAGLSVGAAYALIAMGLCLTFWTTKTLNFGQGSLLMFGAVAFTALVGEGVPATLAFAISLTLGGVLMVLAERIAIRPLLKHGDGMGWTVSTLGFGFFLQGLVAKYFGSQAIAVPALWVDGTHYISVAGLQLSMQSMSVLATSLALTLVMEWFLGASVWGRAVRAVAHDSSAAAVAGIPVRGVIVLSFIGSGILACLAGVLLAQINGTVDPGFGFNLMVSGFVAAVFGGMGSVRGAMVGGITLGVLEKLVGGYVSTAFEHAMAFAILIGILVARPEGLFGQREINKV